MKVEVVVLVGVYVNVAWTVVVPVTELVIVGVIVLRECQL